MPLKVNVLPIVGTVDDNVTVKPEFIVSLLKVVTLVPPIVELPLKTTVPVPAAKPPEVVLLFVQFPATVRLNVLADNVAPLFIVIAAQVELAVRVGSFAAAAMVTVVVAVGTPEGLQLPAVLQLVEVAPVHVDWENRFVENNKLITHNRVATLVNLFFIISFISRDRF